jgi:DNA-binding LytR/AlgR family response regulator
MGNKFFIRFNGSYVGIEYDDILYIKGKKVYVQIVTRQKTFLIANTLNAIIQYLPADKFCRIHYSYIVGLRYIKSFDRKSVELHVISPDYPNTKGLAAVRELPIGATRLRKLLSSMTLMNYER